MSQVEIDNEKLKKFYERLQKGALVKAVKGWKKSDIPLELIKPDLLTAIDEAYEIKNAGLILSVYYEIGQFTKYQIIDLLKIIYTKKDYSTFLKQVYRFGVYNGLEEEISTAVIWHEDRNLPDAFAWKLKFAKLEENCRIEELSLDDSKQTQSELPSPLNIINEEQSEKKKDFIYLELRPIKRKGASSINKEIEEIDQQPYILSKISKKKLDSANQKHSETLKILKKELLELGYDVAETKHIDAFAIIKNLPAIFEIKSINEDNENDQVRAAISQLYEYRFLYSLKDATLWIVFSERPFSDWIIKYLSQDREIKVLWIENNQLTGTSKQYLN
ncbi:hypothetical protein [Spirosoma flavum]|uniref:Restriction endonuclease n=1 Tax=Spirosoma flavum TaxID=2048557 RepID=A0ABW6ALY4_9BACT